MNRLIAIIDNDESARDGLANLMAALGYETEAYPSADEFMRSAERSGIACLISDVNMPGMTGPELHEKLTDLGEHIPTILVTAYPDDALRERMLTNGVCFYLTKPLSEDKLLACVRELIGRPN